jgi:hypothetical protein
MASGVYSAPVAPALKTLPAFSCFPLKAWPKTASYCLSMVSILRIADGFHIENCCSLSLRLCGESASPSFRIIGDSVKIHGSQSCFKTESTYNSRFQNAEAEHSGWPQAQTKINSEESLCQS